MSTTIAQPITTPKAFSNEPVSDFSQIANREAIEHALHHVRAQLGQDYDLLIAGRREKTGDKLKSLNPSRPSEVIGVHSKATAAQAKEAVETAHAYFQE
jgi:1-pyrroline-5-carboxylate dehydrogenase